MLVLEANPVAARDPDPKTQSVFSGGPVFLERISGDVAAEAAGMGLTLFRESLCLATLDKAVAVVNTEVADTSFTSLAFNLFVNRIIRLSGLLMLGAAGASKDAVAAALEQLVKRECASCGIDAEGGAVTAQAGGNGAIAVSVNSESTIAGHPVRFSFSL